jgi:hypothetical protein
MTTADKPAADRLAASLSVLHAHLVSLRTEAELFHLPQGVVMGLHWLCEDAASTLAHLRGLMAEREAERAVMAAKRESPPSCLG